MASIEENKTAEQVVLLNNSSDLGGNGQQKPNTSPSSMLHGKERWILLGVFILVVAAFFIAVVVAGFTFIPNTDRSEISRLGPGPPSTIISTIPITTIPSTTKTSTVIPSTAIPSTAAIVKETMTTPSKITKINSTWINNAAGDNECQSPPCVQAIEEVKSKMDDSVDPCSDFYQYACGGWIRLQKEKVSKNNVTVGKSTLDQLGKDNFKILRSLLEKNSSSTSTQAEEKAKVFYASCLLKWQNTTLGDEKGGMNDDESETRLSAIFIPRSDYYQVEEGIPTFCTTMTQVLFPEVTARLFVEEVFLGHEASVEKLVNLAMFMFKSMIYEVPWMDLETKEQMSKDFASLDAVVGYPKNIMNSSYLEDLHKDLRMDSSYPGSYWINTLNLMKLRISDISLLASVSQFTSRANAYFFPALNRIVIPAGIARKPIYDSQAPDALNYGHLVRIIAHEMTHALQLYLDGFDFGGIRSRNSSASIFTKRTYEDRKQCVEFQYSEIQRQELKNSSSVDEDIADIIAIHVAFKALIRNSTPTQMHLQGLSREQLYFIAAAQGHCEILPESQEDQSITLPEEKENLGTIYSLTTSTHSESNARIFGTMSNSDDFAHAFNCPVGSPYNPAKKKCRFFGTHFMRMGGKPSE